MQNTISQEQLVNLSEQSAPYSTWYILWLKNWNYSHWLITSTISSLILSEMGAIVLSAYPSLLSNLWLSLGITSSLTISILSGAGVISLGLVTGWLIYAGHLAYQAYTSAHIDYEPLLKLWSSNHETYGIILKKLIENDNFLALSRYIKNYPGAQGLNDYLQDPKNVDSVRKILQLLDKVWSTDRIDQQLKIAILHLLSEHIQAEDAEEHINNIHSLCEILWQNEELNHELILKIFQNSSLLKPYLKDLQSLAKSPEIFKQCIDEPSIIPYQLATSAIGQSSILNTLVPYLKQDEGTELSSLEHQGPIAMEIYKIIQQHHGKTPEVFIKIWDKLLQHPHIAIIEPIVQTLAQSKNGNDILSDVEAIDELFNLFSASEKRALSGEYLKEKLYDMGLMTELIIRLYALSSFSCHFIEHIALEKSQETSLVFIKIYQSKIHNADKEVAVVVQELDKLLIHNQEIIDKTGTLNGSDSNYMQSLNKIIIDYFQNQSAQEAKMEAEETMPVPKRRSITHKILKILNLKGKKPELNARSLDPIEEGEDDLTEAQQSGDLVLTSRWSRNMASSSFFNTPERNSRPIADELASQHSSHSI